jgi:hypothetical protein
MAIRLYFLSDVSSMGREDSSLNSWLHIVFRTGTFVDGGTALRTISNVDG